MDLGRLSRVFPLWESHLHRLEAIQEHRYASPALGVTALVHRSALVHWSDRQGIQSNERMEFLGDALLGYYVARRSMDTWPFLGEGELSRFRSQVACTASLARIAGTLGLGPLLFLGKGEQLAGGSARENCLADALEASLAALCLDGGQEKAFLWLGHILAPWFEDSVPLTLGVDVKTRLQQWMQTAAGVHPTYRILSVEGAAQEPLFVVGAFVGDQEVGRGRGKSKRLASQAAAAAAEARVQRGEVTEELVRRWTARGVQ